MRIYRRANGGLHDPLLSAAKGLLQVCIESGRAGTYMGEDIGESAGAATGRKVEHRILDLGNPGQ